MENMLYLFQFISSVKNKKNVTSTLKFNWEIKIWGKEKKCGNSVS